MKRTTIFLPEQIEKDLHHYARLDSRPTASLVREALEEYVAKRSTGALPSFAGQFASGHADTAEWHEELLFARVAPHGPADPIASPSRVAAGRKPRRPRRG